MISVLKDEYVEVDWALTLSLKESSGTFKMTIDGSEKEFSYTIKPARMSQGQEDYGWGIAETYSPLPPISINTQNGFTRAHASQTLGPVTDTVSGDVNSSACSEAHSQPYTGGSFSRDYTIVFGLDSANFSIGAFTLLFNAFAVQMRIDPMIEKTASKTFSLTYGVSLANV